MVLIIVGSPPKIQFLLKKSSSITSLGEAPGKLCIEITNLIDFVKNEISLELQSIINPTQDSPPDNSLKTRVRL